MTASMIWTWKQEPASPLLCEADDWGSASDNNVESTDEVKTSRAEHASKLLHDLDQWVKEEEPFPDWLEEKIDLPIFDDLPPPPPLINNLDMVSLKSSPLVTGNLDMVTLKPASPLNNPSVDMGLKTSILNNCGLNIAGLKLQSQHHPTIPLTPQHYTVPLPQPIEQTPVLIQELDYGLTTHNTLTPPESPREADFVFTMLQEMQPYELDELVRMRVESLVESPVDNPESSRSSLHEESESMSSPSSESGFSDPEWSMPSTSDLKVIKKRRVTKPYSRTPPEEKRQRKKEQNKNAATRYRMKKKQETEEILGEEKELQQQNDSLTSTLIDLKREVKYLKNLMRDMFKAKGILK